MKRHALLINPDDVDAFRWVVMVRQAEGKPFVEHSSAECDFPDYAAALNAGTLALAAADEQPYENEAADPVGDADCSG